MQIANKVIVVTGAGSGMGRELIIQLVKKKRGWLCWIFTQKRLLKLQN